MYRAVIYTMLAVKQFGVDAVYVAAAVLSISRGTVAYIPSPSLLTSGTDC